jgi:hypothetical protein
MIASRGMGNISPSKMPKGKEKSRRDDTDFTEYAKGGKVKSVAKSLKKAGFYEAGKNKNKRLGIINKVTTKPQRMEIVDKLFLKKK